MYGPPADPRQRIAPVEIVDTPEAYIACLLLGLLVTALALWRRPPVPCRAAFFVTGQTILLTAPLAFFVDTFVYGSFPTVDKTGRLSFLVEGAHIRMVKHPIDALSDPIAGLIGADAGHLWIAQIFSAVLSPMGSVNAQALLYPAAGWWCAWWLFHQVTNNARGSVLMAFPYGMGLHVFRDLNWYTVDGAAIFCLPLFLVGLLRYWRGEPTLWLVPVLVLSAWMDLSLGMLNLSILLLASLLSLAHLRVGWRRMARLAAVSLIALAPLLLWSWLLSKGDLSGWAGESAGWENSSHSRVTLGPLRWGGLEWHRALNVVALALGVVGAWRYRWSAVVRFAVCVGGVFFLLSLGPTISPYGVQNPLFLVVRAIVPAIDWATRPEAFFHVTWLAILLIGAVEIERSSWSKRATAFLYVVFILGWLVMVRTHPAYPAMTEPVGIKMDPGWVKQLLEQ